MTFIGPLGLYVDFAFTFVGLVLTLLVTMYPSLFNSASFQHMFSSNIQVVQAESQ